MASLLMQRNRLAVEVSAAERLPGVIDDARSCQHCFVQEACALLHKVRCRLSPSHPARQDLSRPSHSALYLSRRLVLVDWFACPLSCDLRTRDCEVEGEALVRNLNTAKERRCNFESRERVTFGGMCARNHTLGIGH